MKAKTRLKRFFHWFAKRSVLFVTVFLFGVATVMLCFFSVGLNPNNERAVIGIAVVAAFLSAISAVATLVQAVETQKQREELERPYVIAYFDATNNGALYFVIENSGNSPALDVRFKFDPSPIDHAGRALDTISLFANPISFLPTGKVIRQIVDASHRFLEDGKALKYEVSIKYYSAFGDKFSESIEHDLEYLKQTTLPIKTTNDYLKEISKELEKLSNSVSKAQGFNSFLVETPTKYSSRVKTMRDRRNKPKGVIELLKDFLGKFFPVEENNFMLPCQKKSLPHQKGSFTSHSSLIMRFPVLPPQPYNRVFSLAGHAHRGSAHLRRLQQNGSG